MSPHRLKKQVTLAAKRATKKSDHALSYEEAVRLKIQIVPAWLRWFVSLSGTLAVIAAVEGWLTDSPAGNLCLVIAGLFLIAFGIFGIRRTLSALSEAISSQYIIDLPAIAVETSVNLLASLASD